MLRQASYFGFGFIFTTVALIAVNPALSHFPDREKQTVRPRIDVIPPLGTHLPSYRERYNRPTYLGGKIAYWLEPTSQEAMNWHRSAQRGYYANHAPRMEDRYYYPKPWEVLTVGPRVPASGKPQVSGHATRSIHSSQEINSYGGDVNAQVGPEEQNDGPVQLAPSIDSLPPPH